MDFNDHSNLKDKHAFLSPSKYHWVKYGEEKLAESFRKFMAIERGNRLHALGCECINLGITLPKSKKTLNMYINDAIGFRMNPEQGLFFSYNCFGHTDAISFRKNILRIHDLKTGETRTSMRQLEIYAALFCLEYGVNPNSIANELRIYQNDQILIHEPSYVDIQEIMDKIITSDKQLETLKSEMGV